METLLSEVRAEGTEPDDGGAERQPPGIEQPSASVSSGSQVEEHRRRLHDLRLLAMN